MLRYAFLIQILSATMAIAKPLSVVADIAPVHSLVSMVTAGVIAPDLLLDPRADAHDFSLRPSQARLLAQADVVFYVDEELTPWLSKSLGSLAQTAKSVALAKSTRSLGLEFRSSDHDKDHDHDHADEHSIDPHMWLDTRIAQAWLGEIAGVLGELDSDNKEKYEANAREAVLEINRIMEALKPQFEGMPQVSYISDHDSFQYFERQFGVRFVGSVSDGHATPPSASRLAELAKKTRDESGVCIINSTRSGKEYAEILNGDTNARQAVADPVFVEAPVGPAYYLALIDAVAKGFLACGPGASK